MTGENEDFPPIRCTAIYYVEVQQIGGKYLFSPVIPTKIEQYRDAVVTVFFCVETRSRSTGK